jgi:hypothetical protein
MVHHVVPELILLAEEFRRGAQTQGWACVPTVSVQLSYSQPDS